MSLLKTASSERVGLATRFQRVVTAGVVLAIANVVTTSAMAADMKGVGNPPNPADETIDLFDGIESGDLEVKLICKDAKQCNLLITNKAGKPVNVQLPEVFAGAPVLAQFQQGNLFDFDQQQNNAPQQVGGGIRNNNNNNNQFPAFNFNIAPEKVAQLGLKTVCLQYGRPDPRAAMPYQITPLAEATSNVAVHEICRMLGDGGLSQPAAQAAAWHLNNGMSWDELEALESRLDLGRTIRRVFSDEDLDAAKEAVEKVTSPKDGAETADADSLSLR